MSVCTEAVHTDLYPPTNLLSRNSSILSNKLWIIIQIKWNSVMIKILQFACYATFSIRFVFLIPKCKINTEGVARMPSHTLKFLLTIYYFWIFNLINWIQLKHTNSDLIFLLVIVSPSFILFLLLTVPDSDNSERRLKFLETSIYWDTLHQVLVFSFV